ncbi:hypothetical protein [Brevundimonas balnearis]|uniref:Multidrug transporter n=1 Tax=Brevundimonas balnearis TaxID=1572858 RepID=A0ABV6R4K9_9CAUL
MVWWWWILPGVLAFCGLTFLISGLSALFRGRPLSGLLAAIGGGGLAAAGVAIALFGMNLQTWQRLTYEQSVATISLRQTAPQRFEATVTRPDGSSGAYPLAGDEWRIEAQVLRWEPWANVLGLNAQYRLERLSGRYRSIDQELNDERSAHDLTLPAEAEREPWDLDAWLVAQRMGRYVRAVDTLYGSAAYMPMADGAVYEVWLTQSGLIARPANAAANTASTDGGWVRAR